MRLLPKSVSIRVRYSVPLGVYCRLVNVFRCILRRPSRLRITKHDQVFEAYDVRKHPGLSKERIHTCRRRYKRGFASGVAYKINQNANQYGLDQIPLKESGTFVDCGANVGELGIWARRHGLRYLAFEPEPLEAICNDLNNFDGEHRTMRVALWSHDTKLQFYSKPETADGSAIDMGDAVQTFEVSAARLDSVLDVNCLGSGTRILKVEAEGAEPEVLQGAGNILRHFDYVAVDCGFERGLTQDHTLIEVCNILHKNGYRMTFANLHRVTALFQNEEREQPGGGASSDLPASWNME